jgi:signal transduction histidine kinase
MSRLPLRVRLSVAFATAMTLVLVACALFVYLRLQEDLDDTVDAALEARLQTVVAVARAGGDLPRSLVGEPEEGFAQLVTPDGQLLQAEGGAQRPVLTADEAAGAAAGLLRLERKVPGVDGTSRVFARPAGTGVAVVGYSLEDRDDTLASLVTSFAVIGPIGVATASLIGYLLAAVALHPIERMRRRAEEVSLEPDDPLLPLPAARDEVRRLGVTLNEMLARLRESFERERTFVADASHELRTPIAVVKAELEGALRSGDYGPDVHDSLVAAVAECDQLAQLAEDLLVLAAASEGRLRVRAETLPARDALDAVRDRFTDRAAHSGRTIGVVVEDGLQLRADPVLLRQALGNLVDNSLRHGGGAVLVRAMSDGDVDFVDVSDAGPGFGPDLARVAFERFRRGDAARTRGGSGLGLAIVRAVAEAHGGSAEIEPDGLTATVRLRLPRPSQGDLR